ncbi:MAG: serine protein kinase RIO [Candidatus Hydrothermarchaeaceae archaeon]
MLEKKISRLDSKIDRMRKRIKGVEDYKIYDAVFDKRTLLTLYTLANKGVIDILHGTMKTGKESNVFLGKKGRRSVAVKIHLVGTSDYRSMTKYIDGDRRFKGVKKTKRSIVYVWVKKEFRNMNRAMECGIRVPRPMAFKNNVLVMEFLGRRGRPFPKLKEVVPDDPKYVFETLVGYMRKLYQDGNMVHADLSEYNVLMKGDEPILIDISQGVILDHPLADEFLKRDVDNVCRYFGRYFKTDTERVLKRIKKE